MKYPRKLLSACLVLVSLSVYAVEGWKMSSQGDALIYIPENLHKGKMFTYAFIGPFKLDGADLKTWFGRKTRAIQNGLGKPLNEWIIKPNKGNWSISNAYVDEGGNRISVGYEGGMLKDDRAYIMLMLSTVEILPLMKYSLAYSEVLEDAKKQLKDKAGFSSPSVTVRESRPSKPEKAKKPSSKQKRKAIAAAIRVTPGQGVDPSEIETLWVDSDIDLIWGGMDVDTYLLLEDGTYYKDCEIPPGELNVAVSRQLQPEKWGVWRKSWGDYQIKNRKTGAWEDLEGGPGEMAKSGTKLSGSYVNAGGSQFFGSWKRTITFRKDGSFELDSFSLQDNSEMGGGETAPLVTVAGSSDKRGTSGASSVIGDHVGGGTSSKQNDGSKNTGRYEIDDFTITLVHDNGWKHTELFLYEDRKDKKSIVYGNDLYFYKDD